MSAMYNKVTGITAAQAVGIAAIAIPGYIIYTECKKGKTSPYKVTRKWSETFTDSFNSTTTPTKKAFTEEDILEAKIRSENLRPGPAFLDSHSYHNRRTERVKTAYNACWSLVNQNLESGNRQFKVAITENDIHILNVLQRLLVEELGQDGYTAKVKVNPMKRITETGNAKSAVREVEEDEFYLKVELQ